MGLGPCDFEKLRSQLAKTRNLVSLGNEITRVRILFKFAYDSELIDRPIRYGQSFKRPSRRALQKVRQSHEPRRFQADEIRALLDLAASPLKTMILLGINCGFGPADCGSLEINALDLSSGWVTHPRPKTGVQRRCPLWPETITSLKQSLEKRPAAGNERDSGLVFLTKYGHKWTKETSDNTISKEFAKIVQKAHVKRGGSERQIHRRGLGFSAIRHTFQTIGDAACDPIATRSILGHAEDPNDRSAVYREGVDDERLLAVVNHVRAWLFSEGK